MTHQVVLLIAFLKSFLLVNKTDGYVAAHLGEECVYDIECQQKDLNSHCSNHDQRLMSTCDCKINYHVEIINYTAKCIYGELPEDDREGLTAAPIILCFMGCVVIETFCFLAFRYWKKHRRTRFTRHGTLQLQAISLTDARFTHNQQGPTISFMITPEMDALNSGARSSSPPPYNQTTIGANVAVQAEEPPPPYEEAIKQCAMNSNDITPSSEKKSIRRKMSC